jgi:hypothetical protein
MDLLRLQTTTDAPSIAEARPDLPRSLAKTVQRMLERDPAARWPALRDVERAFRSAVADAEKATREMRTFSAVPSQPASKVVPVTLAAVRQKVAERKAGEVETKARPVRFDVPARRRTVPIFAGLSAAAVIAISAALWFSRDGDSDEGPIPTQTVADEPPLPPAPLPEPPSVTGGSPQVATAAALPEEASDDAAMKIDSAPPVVEQQTAALPTRRESTIVIPPVRRESVVTPPRPTLPASTSTDARRVGNALVTLINQGRWRELESLGATGGDASAREAVVGLVRNTRGIAAGFDRLPSAPIPHDSGFDTEFIVELVLGAGANAERTYVTVTARATHDGTGWVLAGWRVERTL